MVDGSYKLKTFDEKEKLCSKSVANIDRNQQIRCEKPSIIKRAFENRNLIVKVTLKHTSQYVRHFQNRRS